MTKKKKKSKRYLKKKRRGKSGRKTCTFFRKKYCLFWTQNKIQPSKVNSCKYQASWFTKKSLVFISLNNNNLVDTHRQKCLYGRSGSQHHMPGHPGEVSSIHASDNRDTDSVLAVDTAMAHEPAPAPLSYGPEALDSPVQQETFCGILDFQQRSSSTPLEQNYMSLDTVERAVYKKWRR